MSAEPNKKQLILLRNSMTFSKAAQVRTVRRNLGYSSTRLTYKAKHRIQQTSGVLPIKQQSVRYLSGIGKTSMYLWSAIISHMGIDLLQCEAMLKIEFYMLNYSLFLKQFYLKEISVLTCENITKLYLFNSKRILICNDMKPKICCSFSV